MSFTVTTNARGEQQSKWACICCDLCEGDSISGVDRWSGDRREIASNTARHCAKGEGKRGSCSRKGARRPLHGLVWLLTLFILPLTYAQEPTTSPTDFTTLQQTIDPTSAPTITPQPVSANPTDFPSGSPFDAPTAEPTFSSEIVARAFFNQRFQIGNNEEFNETEKVLFCNVFENYTEGFGGRFDERVNTTCEVLTQSLQIIGGSQRGLRDGPKDGALEFFNNEKGRRLQVVFNQVDYLMSYRSNHTNVTEYPALFQTYVNNDLDKVTGDLQNASLAVENSFLAFNTIATQVPTTLPTTTPRPTGSPSIGSIAPSMMPSPSFSRDPAIPAVTEMPTLDPSNEGPTTAKSGPGTSTIVAVSVMGAVAAALVGLFVFYRRRKHRSERKFQEAAAGGAQGGSLNQVVGGQNMRIDTEPSYPDPLNGKQEVTGMISPADSLYSKESMISNVPSPLSEGSEREEDGTHTLTDEFDQYKDQNLEVMRTGVEGNLSGFDGMMSQALTKALVDDDLEAVDMNDLSWGGSGDSAEIEATVLCEVNDWLKRNEMVTMEEKGAYMQETLNKMVASVRHGVMDPDCGSRTIHECAALLGLQLASNIPGNALIVTGMPKWVKSPDLIAAFVEFGEIESAAVSSNRRGFGLVRFKSIKSVQGALSKFRTGEIVVQDVAVMVKALKSDDGRGFPPPADKSLSRHSSRTASPIVNEWRLE